MNDHKIPTIRVDICVYWIVMMCLTIALTLVVFFHKIEVSNLRADLQYANQRLDSLPLINMPELKTDLKDTVKKSK